MTIELRPHQVEALVPTAQVLGRQPRATVVMACGTGKTLLGAAVGQQVAPSGTVLVAVPTIELLGQTAAPWSAYAPDRRITAVCSDAEVLQVHGVESRNVTTKPADLAGLTGRQLVLCTYASLPVVAEAHRLHGLGEWGLAVADEAHRTAGAQDKAWGQIHENGAVPAARRLNLTATPRYFDIDTNAAVSMDDERFFGPVAHRLSFAEAIRRKLLNDYRVVVPVITDADMVPLLEQAKRYLAADEMVDAQALALAVAVIKATDKHRMRKAISYHSAIPDAVEFSRAMRLAARLLGVEGTPRDVNAAFVHGEQAMRARQAAMATLRESGHELELLANVKILAEGVDIPAVDGVVFAYAKTSMPEIIQAVGRAMRLHGDNDTATIMIPVFVPEGLTAESAVNDSRYAGLWRVLQALRAVDDRMEDPGLLRSALTGRYEDAEAADRPPRVYIEASHVPEGFASAIEVRTLNFDARSEWLTGALAARRLFQEQGHLTVPFNHTAADGFALGRWLSNQRTMWRRGRLLPARAEYLTSLGMEWETSGREWKRSFAYAEAYAAEHGDLSTSYTHATYKGFRLSEWLRVQRAAYRKDKLAPGRVAALERLGIRWEATFDQMWEDGLRQAADHQRRHGDLKVTKDFVADNGFHLGAWLATQRLKRKKGTLAQDRIEVLDTLGIDWGTSVADRWRAGIDAAEAYLAEYGDLLVPSKHVSPAGFHLGLWIDSRRKGYATGLLSTEQIAELELLGMVWSIQDMQWQTHMDAARRYFAEHGDLMVARAYVDPVNGDRLGPWIMNVRSKRRKGALSAQQIAELDSVGMAWNILETSWQTYIKALKDYRDEHHHTRVPTRHITSDGLRLGIWLHNARNNSRRGSLSAERETELRELGVVLPDLGK